jgi:hypothetical protein
MFPHLSGSGRVNVSLIQEPAIKELLAILERCDGSTKVGPYPSLVITKIMIIFILSPGHRLG